MKKKLMAALAAGALAVIPASAAMADEHLGSFTVLAQTIEIPPADETGQVVIVHGVPDLTVDIFVNGAEYLTDVNFEAVATDDLEPGDYEIAIAPAGDGIDEAVLEGTATVAAGTSATVIAHLTADGSPTLSVFGNNTDTEGIQVGHFAAFGAVDITPTDVTGLAGVENGDVGFAATGAGDFDGLGIAPAGGDNVVDLPTLSVGEGEVLLAFAVGAVPAPEEAPEDEVDEEAEEEVEQPTHVDSGTGGLLDTGLPVWVAALMIMGALGIAAPAVATARRRS